MGNVGLNLTMSDLFIILAVLIAGFVGLYWLVNKRLNGLKDDSLVEWLKNTQLAMNQTSQNINKTLHLNTQATNERLDNAAKYMANVAEQIGEMSEIGRSMKDLQEFLQSPKLRGNLGEEVLQDLMAQMFPKNSFYSQYVFKSGEKVDVALKTDAGTLPIDSKFPMENFRRLINTDSEKEKSGFRKLFINDVRKHIRSIAKKYIVPNEGTMDFAIMYIPSESVYYEVVNEPELLDYARNSRVYMVSPSTLYALLQTILLSFEGKKIEARTRQIFQMLRSIQGDYKKTTDELGILGRHLGNAYAKLGEVQQVHGELGIKLQQTKMLEDN